MRAYLAIASRSFQQMITYRFEAWLGMLISLAETVTFVALWHAVSRGDSDTLHTVLAYLMATRVLNEMQQTEVMGKLRHAVRTGNVALELLKPVPYPLRLAADGVGRVAWRMLRMTPVYVVIGWVLGVSLPDLPTLLAFVVSGIMAFIVTMLLEMAAASVVFFVVDIEGVHNMLEFCRAVFAGALIPMWMLPDWFVSVAELLPFQAVLYIPGAIFARQLTGGGLWAALARQALWVLILGLVVQQAWRLATRKLVVQGG